eukprot:gene4679-8251_t
MNLESQLEEIEVLESIFFGEGEFLILSPDFQEIKKKKKVSEISFQIKLIPEEISISFTYPLKYPNDVLKFSINSTKFSSKEIEELTNGCTEFLHERSGEESVFDLIEFIKENKPEEIKKIELIEEEIENPTKVLIGVHFHHIYADGKKREIQNGKSVFKLKGIYKFGKPGRLLVYGNQNIVNQFIMRLKSLNWQEIKVKFEYEIDLDDKLTEYIGTRTLKIISLK